MLAPKLIAAQVLPNYRVQLQFADGKSGVLDMSDHLDFGVFTRLREPGAFAQARVAFDTLEWPCGVDLDPAFVYEKSTACNVPDAVAK